MEAELVMDNNPRTWERGLEGLIAINEEQLDNSLLAGFFPPLYQSGVVYRPEKNSEKWKTLKQVYQDGMGDCEDLAAVRCAELRVSGEDPLCRAHIYQTGPRRWHATIQRSNGQIEDPTKILKALEKQRKKGGKEVDNMSAENKVLGQYGAEYAPYGYGDPANISPYNMSWADPSQWAGYGLFDAGGNWSDYGASYAGFGGFGGYPTGYEYGGYDAYGGYPGAYDYGYGAYGQYPPGYGGYGYGGYGGYGAYGGEYQDPYAQSNQYAQSDPYAQAEQMYNEAVAEAQQELDRQKARMRKRRELQQANRQRRQARLQARRQKRRERMQAQRERQRARREAQRQRRERRRQWEAQAAAERRKARPKGWHL